MADTLAATLATYGVETIFGASGDALPDLRTVVCQDEQAAVHAASAYAAISGRAGVVVASGDGLIPTLPGLVPLLLLSIDVPAGDRADATPPGHHHRVADADSAAAAVAAAFAQLGAGPVQVELTADVLERPWPDAAPAGPGPAADPAAVERAAALLAGADRPLIVVGAGGLDATAAVTALAEEIGAPVATTVAGKGAVDEGHPLAAGASVPLAALRAEIAASDVVLVVGGDAPIDLPAGGIDTRTLGGDVAAVVAALLAALPTRRSRLGVARAAALRAGCRSESRATGGRYEDLADALRDALPAQSVLVGDGSAVTHRGAVPFYPVAGPRRFHCAPAGTRAGALPALAGAVAARPGSPVAALVDVDAFLAGVPELAALVALGRPLPIVVVDHGSGGTDLAALAAAHGAEGIRAISPDGIEDLVADALEVDRPTIIHLDWVD